VTNETPKIKGLDGTRAISVGLVVLTHIGALQNLPPRIYQTLQGTTGVIIFFALSGFLITHLLIREHQRFAFISLTKFYIRRTLRIVPLYLTVIFLTAAINQISYVAKKTAIVFALIYATNFIDKSHYSGMLGHTWSIAVEEHFYLIWPAALALWIKGNWRLAAIVLSAFSFLSLIAANLLFHSTYLSTNFFVDRWTFVAAAPIAMGALIAIIVTTEFAEALRDALASRVTFAGALALICHSLIFPDPPLHLGDFLRGAGAAIVIGWLFLNQQSAVVRWLEFAPLRYIGLISYGIYMWQGFFLATGPERAPGQLWPPSPWIGIALLSVVAPLSFSFFEQPILRIKKRFEH